MSTKGQQETPKQPSLSDKGMQDARQVINMLTLAWKNYGLYPEDHVSTIKSFENLVAVFNKFLTTHGSLRLTVEKNRFLCGTETIYEVSPEAPSEDLITLLYRDGIKWIEFQEGIPFEEISSFLRIAYKYRLFVEETEGDIVTALMDEELEYIDFKAVDIFWQDLLVMDFSQLPPPAPPPDEVSDQTGADLSQQSANVTAGIYARSIADPSISKAQLTLTDDDYESLQRMIREEESWDISEDLFELLLIILEKQSGEEKFSAVLEFISEVAIETLEHDKFKLLLELFQSLHKLTSPETSTDQGQPPPDIDRFFHDISKPEVFQILSDKLLQLPTGDTEKLKALGKLLHYFSPEVIPFLVPVIMQRSSPRMLKMIFELIVRLSRRDISPLEEIAEHHGAEMGEKLLLILNYLQGDRVNGILFKMCKHPSDKIRRKAIKELLDRAPLYVEKLFSLIDDPSKIIRIHILTALAKQKSTALENALLNYLEEYSKDDPEHILACYRALGRCGSNASIPFLSKTLLERGWNSFMGSGKSVFREGAAIALALLDTSQAKDVLKKASKSKFKVVREAFDKSKAVTVSGESTNG